MKDVLLNLLILSSSLFAVSSNAAFVAVPNSLEIGDGNSASSAPFNVRTNTVRYQEVFAASQFESVAPLGGQITDLWFRPDIEFGGGFNTTLLDIEIRLSTTPRGPDTLSLNFSENVGADEAVVVGRGPLFLSSGGGTTFFNIHIALSRPFFYNPQAGHLLMEVRNLGGGNTTFFDAVNTAGDSVSSVVALSNRDDTSLLTAGLVTGFGITPVSELTVSLQSSNLVFRWVNQRSGFTLQQSAVIGPGANWQPAGGIVTTNGDYKIVTLPLDFQASARFFRLTSQSSSGAGEPQSNSGSPALPNHEP